MKKISIFIICLVIILSIGLVGCGKTSGYNFAADPDNDENFKFDDYDYTNPEKGNKHWRDLEVETGFKIDGVLGEAAYAPLKSFPLKDSTNEFELVTKVHLGEKGAYIAAVMSDSSLFFKYGRPLHMNSSVIFTLDTVLADKKLPALSVDTLQLRVGVNGEIEQWMGRAYEGYEYFRAFYPAMARTTVIAEDNTLTPINYLADYSAQKVKGYNVEAFIPWSAFNLTQAPNYLLVRPEFNKVFDMAVEDSGGRINAGYRSHKDPEQFVPFDSKGASNDLLLPSEKSWVTGSDGVITQTDGGDKKLFVKDANGNPIMSTKYYFETEVSIVSDPNGDAYPKPGILAGQLNNNTYFYSIDSLKSTNYTNNLMLAVNCASGTDDWKWPSVDKSGELGKIDNMPSYKDGNYVKMAVMRDGADWYFFVQDKLIGKRTNIRGFSSETPSYFGMMTMGTSAKYKNINFCESDEAETKLNSLIGLFNAPTKITYSVGQEIDLTGGTLTKRDYDNRLVTIETLTTAKKDEYNIKGFDTTTKGTKTVNLTIKGVECSYEITVN